MVDFSSITISDQILIILLFLLIFIIITFYFVFSFRGWSQNLRYIKMEIRRAENESEANHWKRELKILYWSLIPGLTVQRIKKIIRFLNKGRK